MGKMSEMLPPSIAQVPAGDGSISPQARAKIADTAP